jgi:hypothetical protein
MATEVGVCLVPVSVEGQRRDNVVYRPLDEEKAVSPIIMSIRKGDIMRTAGTGRRAGNM